jgi:class 3 adenylate cyclase
MKRNTIGNGTKMSGELYNCWQWRLKSTPEALWPYVANTDRFNRDTSLPAIQQIAGDALTNARRRLKFRLPLVNIIWEEEPFEWSYPTQFGVIRNYLTGPLRQMRTFTRLQPLPDGGTHLIYETWIQPRNILGRLGWPFIAFISKQRFAKVFTDYDEMALSSQMPIKPQSSHFAPGGRARLEQISQRLVARQVNEMLVNQLMTLVTTADNMTLSRLRPYAFANQLGIPRRDALELFLLATREGMLTLQWDVLCPFCRGAQQSHDHLTDIESSVHCESCQIDFRVNFNQSVELTFTPNENIRPVERLEYCIAGPEVTPHIVTQQLLPPNSSRTVMPVLENGRYRCRTLSLPGGQYLQVTADGLTDISLSANNQGWPTQELQLAESPSLRLENLTGQEQLMIFERMAWSDDAVTAAEVTTLQRFRDLFADEALRPGEQISVGSLTILFTDLRDSTRMYREIGDATAFGLVMNHFDVLRETITAENGAIVKTIGDAVMAVFQRPLSALRAILAAQDVLATPPPGGRPFHLKAALHYGPTIAVNLNERLDYFGTTVNMASRLEKFSQGGDVIMSDAIYFDPEIQEFLQFQAEHLLADAFTEELKGFDGEFFDLWRLVRHSQTEPAVP